MEMLPEIAGGDRRIAIRDQAWSGATARVIREESVKQSGRPTLPVVMALVRDHHTAQQRVFGERQISTGERPAGESLV